MEDNAVYAFPKARGQEVRASLSTYEGRRLADVRVWVDVDGEYRPSKRGISVAPELLPELLEAVGALYRAAREEQKSRNA